MKELLYVLADEEYYGTAWCWVHYRNFASVTTSFWT